MPVAAADVNAGEILWDDLIDKATDTVKDKILDAVKSALEDSVDGFIGSFLDEFPIAAVVEVIVKWAVQFGTAKRQSDIITDALASSSIVDPAPAVSLIDQFFTALNSHIIANGARLRIPLASLEAGDTFYADEVMTIRPKHGPAVALGFPLETILRAAIAFPGWFPAVKIGTQNFVDGSLQDPAPIAAAIDAGAHAVYVLQPNKRTLRASTSFDGSPFMTSASRADMMRETDPARAGVAPFEGWPLDVAGRPVGSWRVPVTLIEATLSLFHLTAVDGDVGLIQLWSDYGWMRAFDTIAPTIMEPHDEGAQRQVTAFLQEKSDDITALRYEAWLVEHQLAGELPSHPPGHRPSEIEPISDDTAAAPLRDIKSSIRAALVSRLVFVQGHSTPTTYPHPAAVPGSASFWFQHFEAHPWDFPFIAVPNNPWSAMSGFGTGGTVPAAPMPAPLPVTLFQPVP